MVLEKTIVLKMDEKQNCQRASTGPWMNNSPPNVQYSSPTPYPENNMNQTMKIT